MNWLKFFDKTIEYSFYFLLFLTPLILTPYNYELFEYNKMMLVYFMVTIIVGAWAGKGIVNRKINFQRTPLDIPIVLFLISQILSTVFSIDVHTSIWGYYSRFHGGLFSTVSYILLYYAFVTNMAKTQNSNVKSQNYNSKLKTEQSTINNQQLTINCLYILLASAALVTFYGVLEHFGIDAKYWVQDVRNRVFSTLGQPNWLGAWIDGLIFIPVAFLLSLRGESTTKQSRGLLLPRQARDRNDNKVIFYLILFIIFYFCLLFTGSRSAYFGFLAALISFLLLLVFKSSKSLLLKSFFFLASFSGLIFSFLSEWKRLMVFKVCALAGGIISLILAQFCLKKEKLKIFNFVFGSIILISLLAGTPLSRSLLISLKERVSPPSGQPLAGNSQPMLPLTPHISNSDDIRKVVWQGALDVWRHWPVFGSGVETFAYSYYNFRPRAHNDLSEWDFLYNKAHNEYLNYLATTGIIGLGTHLLLIGWFLFWCLKKISKETGNSTLVISLIAGYVSILVTNFFGFSVVPVALLFWLFPAFVFVLTNDDEATMKPTSALKASAGRRLNNLQSFFLILLLFCILYSIFYLLRLWWADYKFASGKKYSDAGYLLQGYQLLAQAIKLNPSEPLYHSTFSENAAMIALTYQQKDSSNSAQLVDELTKLAISESQKSLTMNSVHLNYYKSAAKVYIYLASINSKYYDMALQALKEATQLSPTDAKLFYNLGLLYQQLGQKQPVMENFEKAVALKPDYIVTHLALAKVYRENKMNQKAIDQLQFILTQIDANQGEALGLLKEWQKK